MRNHKKYRSTVIDLFQSFLAGKINIRELIYGLTEIEKDLKQDKNTLKGLWFRFFTGDTGATTVMDIYRGLEGSTNDKYYKECMQLSIDNPKELKIYFS